MKIIKIANCEECPWLSWDRGAAFCDIGPNIPDPTTIHPDCPLEDERECEWTQKAGSAYLFIPNCKEWGGLFYQRSAYCPCCGGKIRIKKGEE